jgi:pimeloyl-ACP methyl ester carboxylesterase
VFLGCCVQDVYAPVIAHLHKLGYREGVNLFIFDYDWRRSAFDNAAKLESFVREKIPDPFQRFDILAHSMGGLVARIYALRHDTPRSWRGCSAPARRSMARSRSMPRSRRAGARSTR